jgi:hypothetical protein
MICFLESALLILGNECRKRFEPLRGSTRFATQPQKRRRPAPYRRPSQSYYRPSQYHQRTFF